MLKYLLCLLMVPAVASACPDIAVPVVPTHHVGSRDRLMATVHGRSEPVLIVGDSIAEQWPRDMRDAFFGMPSYNFGLGGDRLGNIVWRLERARYFPGNEFKTIVLIAGTNNLGVNSACEIAHGLIKLAAILSEMSPLAKVYVVSILPRGPGLRTDEATIAAVNAAVHLVPGIRFVNAHGPIRDCAEACYLPDNLHLSRKGYEVLGEALHEAIRR